jgi:hypothetical protein
MDRKQRRTWEQRKCALDLSTAFHEASHAVAHFAVENPHGELQLVLVGDEIVEKNGETVGGYYHSIRMGGQGLPCVNNVWWTLAGPAGEYLHCGQPRGLRRDSDHLSAANDLMPWNVLSFAPYYCLLGRFGNALRHERKNVEQLLRENWHVVKRVAEAAVVERTLDDAQLRGLIEEPGDLIHVWNSSVWSAYSEACRKYLGLWKEQNASQQHEVPNGS